MGFDYIKDYNFAKNDPASFWKSVSKSIHWDKEYDSVYSGNELKPDWFKGGLLNICYNVLDRNVNESTKDRYALICECPYLKQSVKITYSELYEQVCKFSGVLVSLGVTKGDNVLIYMPTSIQACIAMLSCSRIGATHVVLFGGSNEFDLVEKINVCKPKVIILSNYGFSNNDLVPYTPFIIKALEILLASYRPNHIITFNRDDHFDKQFISTIPSVPNSLDWNQLITNESINPFYSYIQVESSHPLYLIYTSGTTGKPKGIVRDNGGSLVSNYYLYKCLLDTENHIKFITTANIGWASTHSFLHGILYFGGTLILYEGITTISNHLEASLWEIIERNEANYAFTTPTIIRVIQKYDPQGKSILKHNLSKLRVLWVGGEMVDQSLFAYSKSVGIPLHNIMGQTESPGAYIISFRDKGKLNRIGIPIPGYIVSVLSDDGKELDNNQTGELVLKLPLPPGFATTLYNDRNSDSDTSSNSDSTNSTSTSFYNIYYSKYKGYYRTGDSGFKDQDGYISITSRVDDIIVVSVFKFKGSIIEDAILTHDKVLECNCIGVSDEISGEAPIAFITLKEEFKNQDTLDFNSLKNEINNIVQEKCGALAKLKKLLIVDKLAKNRNGKSLKSILKKMINVKDYSVPYSVENTEIQILNNILNIYNSQKDQ